MYDDTGLDSNVVKFPIINKEVRNHVVASVAHGEKMKTYESYEDLKQQLTWNKGVLSVPMSVLRDLEGVNRLGKNVVQSIEANLKRQGIAHDPNNLPGDASKFARLYIKGTGAGKLIDAVLNPGKAADEVIQTAGLFV